jgi:hypothetical protein
MARPRSHRVKEVKAKLVARLGDGFHRPGQPFLSNRAVAERYGVSYQTAHRILAELVAEGRLLRREGKGTFVAGRVRPLRRVALVFNPRANRPGSFGEFLRRRLLEALRGRGLPATEAYVPGGGVEGLPGDVYPVLWEEPALAAALAKAQRYALMLHDRPEPGLGASYLDSVTTDDYSGGVCAGELLRQRTLREEGFVVLAGPAGDRRARDRLAGFRAACPGARAVAAESWFREAGAAVAPAVWALRPSGVFASNDRLAEGFLAACVERGMTPPPTVGFDNAPIAEALNLTTIAIPWEELVEAAVEIAAMRLEGSHRAARHLTLSQRPVVRLSG